MISRATRRMDVSDHALTHRNVAQTPRRARSVYSRAAIDGERVDPFPLPPNLLFPGFPVCFFFASLPPDHPLSFLLNQLYRDVTVPLYSGRFLRPLLPLPSPPPTLHHLLDLLKNQLYREPSVSLHNGVAQVVPKETQSLFFFPLHHRPLPSPPSSLLLVSLKTNVQGTIGSPSQWRCTVGSEEDPEEGRVRR